MADQFFEVLEELQQAGRKIRRLAEHTLKAAADLSPADREEVRKSVMRLETFSERLAELAATNDPNLAALRLGLDEAPWNLLNTAIETLDRIGHKTDDGTDEPLN